MSFPTIQDNAVTPPPAPQMHPQDPEDFVNDIAFASFSLFSVHYPQA